MMFLTNNNLNNQAEVISRSPLIAYNMVYEFHSFDNLHNTIKRVSEKNEVSNYEIIADMETFANVYELFRPNSITYSDYYWGSVKTIDAIFTTLYRFVESENLRRFSKGFYYTEYGNVERIPFEKISWKMLLADIVWIISIIKKSIGREALKLYIMFDSDFIGLKYEIIEYIRLIKQNENLTIEFFESPNRKIIIDGHEVIIDKYHSVFSLEDEIFNREL